MDYVYEASEGLWFIGVDDAPFLALVGCEDMDFASLLLYESFLGFDVQGVEGDVSSEYCGEPGEVVVCL